MQNLHDYVLQLRCFQRYSVLKLDIFESILRAGPLVKFISMDGLHCYIYIVWD